MSNKTILILGGNGFIGAECVEFLLDKNENNYELVLVNRGNYDDWDTETRIKSRISENIICDRKTGSLKDALNKYLSKENFKFEAVVDFSAYKSRVVKNFIRDIPADKIKLYILISTDSVYEVCSTKQPVEGQEFYLYETDSNRPENKLEQIKLKELDSYGHHKLKCEEEILKQAVNGFPYVILRLPDVIGERDSTNRFWFYQMYLEYLDYLSPNQDKEISISKFYFNKKTGYVYVKDVAKVIDQIIKSNIRNEIFNLGYDESMSINDILTLIASLIRPGLEKDLKFKSVEENVKYIYEPFPSVTKGPVNTEKIKRILNFKPSNLTESFRETVEFYKHAYTKYTAMRKIIEKDLKEELIKNSNDRANFKSFIDQISNKKLY